MIKTAVIESTMLGRENHGIMTFFISVKFDRGITYSSIGGYALDGYDKKSNSRIFGAKSMQIISKILEIVGVDRWEDLTGKYIRIEDTGLGRIENKIGNISEDKWLDFDEFMKDGGTIND